MMVQHRSPLVVARACLQVFLVRLSQSMLTSLLQMRSLNDATLGVAAFFDDHFNVTDGFVDIADGAITSAKIADGTIVNADIANGANISDTKLDDIDTIGKVKIQAIDIEDAAVNTSGQALQAADEFIIRDVSATTATDSGNRVFSLGAIQDFLDSAIGGVANAHADITGAADVNGTVENLTYIEGLDFDQYGHVVSLQSLLFQTLPSIQQVLCLMETSLLEVSRLLMSFALPMQTEVTLT